MLVYITIISFNNSIYAFCCIAAFFHHLQGWHIQHAFLYDDVLTEKKKISETETVRLCVDEALYLKNKTNKNKISCLLHPKQSSPSVRGKTVVFILYSSDVAHLHPTPVALPQQKQAVAMNL